MYYNINWYPLLGYDQLCWGRKCKLIGFFPTGFSNVVIPSRVSQEDVLIGLTAIAWQQQGIIMECFFGSLNICVEAPTYPSLQKSTCLCMRQRASWTYPPQVFTSVHLFNKIVGPKFTISSLLFKNNWVKIQIENKVRWRFTKLIDLF